MAKTRGSRKRTWWVTPRRRFVLVSLLVQNPSKIKRKVGRRRIAAAVAVLPEEILVSEIFVRLPAKDIIRCRAVCRYWCSLTSAPDFLLAHYRRQPSLLLLELDGTAAEAKGGSPIFKRGHRLLGFDDHEGFKLLASCDGLLLLFLSNGGFSICNPTTRRCSPLPCLNAAGQINIAALYMHCPSGEYRVLYWKDDNLKADYYVFVVGRRSLPRCIGVPSDIPRIDKVMMAWHKSITTSLTPPVVFRNCLHWDFPDCENFSIIVFNTVAESFRFMPRPAAATGLCTSLNDMDGSIGFSCVDDSWRSIKIWVLEDYEREVWSFKFHVKFPVEILRNLAKIEDAQHLFLSNKGDVLVYNHSTRYMFYFDITGKLLETFQWGSWGLTIVGHWFKESLVNHDISLRRRSACVRQLRFF